MLLIRNAIVAGPRGPEKSDIFIVKDRIAEVAPELTQPADAVAVEANGRLALPGLIDIHAHLREPGGEYKEDLCSGTQAALAGGVTTVLWMPNTEPPITDQATLEAVLDLAAKKAVCDYGLYLGATRDNVTTAPFVQGAVGLKMYMGSTTGSLLLTSFEDQYAHLKAYPSDRVLAVHAENEESADYFAKQKRHRPPLCAALGVARAIWMAQSVKRPIHICTLSTAQEIQMIKEAKERGEPVTCEVTPHHLLLSFEIEQHLGPLGRMMPPLRSAEDVAALWDNLKYVDAIASDHSPHTLEEKNDPHPPPGGPGLETMLPLLLTAVRQQMLSLTDLVRLTATGPAKLFGLERKGRLAPGYDADIVLVDHRVPWTISNKDLRTRCGWTPFEGWRVWGKVEKVYLRGKLAFADGQVLARPGAGRQVRQTLEGASS
jgi:dihydroorotase (multifunctional complex type)